MYLREQKRKKMVKSLIILKGQSCGITSVRSSIIPDIKGWVDFNDTPHYFDKPLTYSQYKMFVP